MVCSADRCTPAARVGTTIQIGADAAGPPAATDGCSVWVSTDGREVALLRSPLSAGAQIEIPKPALTIDLSSDLETDSYQLSFERDEGERWVAKVGRPPKTIRVEALAGDYILTISSKDHLPSQQRFKLRNKERIRVHLAAAPAITGTIKAAVTQSPVREAEISDENGDVLAVTDDHGRFRIGLEGERPAALTIAAAGYGRRSVAVPKEEDDLGVLLLYPGATLTLELLHPYGGSEPIPVDVSLYSRGPAGRESLAKKASGTTAARIEIVDLAAGAYRLHVKGPEPLQQSTKPITVSEGADEHLNWFLTPRTAHVRVTRDGEAIPDARVEMKASTIWRASIPLDQAGEYAGELWDAESFAITVSGGPLRTPYLAMHRVGDANPVSINVDVPTGLIGGVVLDGETRRPITTATIRVESRSDEVSYNQSTQTDDEGRFEFSGAMAGSHALSIEAPRYLPERVELTTKRNEEKELDVLLMPGRVVRVTVADARGALLPNALIALGITSNGVSAEKTAFTDAQGTAEITTDWTTTREALVIETPGAFLWTTIGPDTPDEVQVRLPPATSRLVVTTRGSEGARANVGIVARYNGRLIPFQIWTSMLGSRGRGTRTDGSGQLDIPQLPPGRYDLFAFESPSELLGLLASHRSRTPASVDLHPGAPATVALTLEDP